MLVNKPLESTPTISPLLIGSFICQLLISKNDRKLFIADRRTLSFEFPLLTLISNYKHHQDYD